MGQNESVTILRLCTRIGKKNVFMCICVGKSCSRDGMVRPVGIDASLYTEYVNLSFWSFAFWWVVILAVHLLTSAYNASFAKFYWDFDATFLSYILEPYSIGMPRENFRTIAYVHVLLASVHGLCVLHQLVCSFWTRTISFTMKPQDFSRSSKGVAKVIRQPSSYQLELKQDRTASLATRSLTQAYIKIADRRGLFGVNGRYFHGILICREFLETTLQTIQAVRMSKYLPRPEINHFYVGLLVVNCWSAVIIYSSWFWRDEARRRFALVVSDCMLDMMTTVGVSAMVVMPYVSQYNVALAGFNIDSLSDDNWMAQMLNEAQMVLVVSWSDLAMRIVFSLGLILTTANMKDLLRRSPIQKRQIGHTVEPHFNVRMTTAGIRHINWSTQLLKKRFTVKNTKGYVKTKSRWAHTVHLVFLLWGAVVIALHVHANMKMPLVGCIPRVHPMAGALPTCFAVNFNCHTIGISGRKDEVLLEWGKFERKKVVKLRILHCQMFEMPTTLQDFHLLQEFRVYNSTIGDWSEDAAITNTHHRSLTTLSVVRTNMDAGLLPVGLQSSDFPSSLLEIYFCETNLQEIPDDIDSKWHIGSSVYLENGQLRSVPPALVRLQLYYLVLAGNPISEVPPELFESTDMLYLLLGRTNISSLPRSVPFPTPSPPYVDVSNTAISLFWSWIDPLVESMLSLGSPMILASGSTYCSDLEKIMDGVSDAFSAPSEADSSPLLMDPSQQNWDFLRLAVDCSPSPVPTAFPLGDWDKMYSLE